MKKTLIAMFALAGVAMGSFDPDTDVLALPADGTTYTVAQGHTANNIGQLVTWAAGQSAGYYFGGNNAAINTNPSGTNPLGTNGEGTYTMEDNVGTVTLLGRTVVAGESFVFVLSPAAARVEAGLFCDKLTLTLNGSPDSTLNVTGSTFAIAIANGSTIQGSATGTLANTKTTDLPTTVTLTLDKPVALTESTKIIAAFRGNGGSPATSSYQITGITATAHYTSVPEPATATLSLLALAGLASRRRRH